MRYILFVTISVLLIAFPQDVCAEVDSTAEMCNQAWELIDIQQYDKAIRLCNRVIELEPENVKAYTFRARAYFKMDDYDRALDDCMKSIELDSTDALAYHNRGSVYYMKGKFDLAMDDFNRAIELDPDWAWPYINRGALHGRLGDYNKAIRDFNRAIEIDPNAESVQRNRAIAYIMKFRWWIIFVLPVYIGVMYYLIQNRKRRSDISNI